MTVLGGSGDVRSPLLGSLSVVIDSARDAMGVQRGGVIIAANQRLAELFGWPSADAMIGTPLHELIAPESRPLIDSYIELRGRGGSPPSLYVVQGRRRDGSTFQLEVRATGLVIDGVPHTLSFARDVTAELVAEDALREREALYRAVFEVNAAIKLLIDPADGRIVDANPAAAQFYGWSLDELRGMTIDQINVLSPAEVAAEMERARTRRRTSFSFRHRTRGGAIADVEVHSGPLVIAGRTLLLSIIHDVTERNRFEEQLRRGQRLEAIGRLAAGIAHDFNNILTVISASAQLASRSPDPTRVAACLIDIRGAATRGATLTGHLLALGRAQALVPVSIELGPLVERLGETLRRVLGDPIEISVDLAREVPRVLVDPGQLELALLNLALNARDAMPQGGTLTFSVDRAGATPPGLAAGDYVALTVADTGVGMDEDTRARIFEPFFTTKLAAGGTGLGLAIALGFLSQSGGTITVDSQPGVGSRFTLFLPVDRGEVIPALPPPAASARFHGTIVLVDDRDDVRQALAGLLDELGFTTRVAASAAAAIALCAALAAPPDLVLSDVTMPGRSGEQLAVELRALYPGLPVVLMSANVSVAARLPPGVGFLAKPFNLAELTAMLQQHAPQCVS